MNRIVRANADLVFCQEGNHILWSFPLSQLALIGEFVLGTGPYEYDHYVLLVSADGRQFEISTEDAGWSELFGSLEVELQADLKLELIGKTYADSCILWPKELRGIALLKFITLPSKGVRDYVLRLCGIRRGRCELSKMAASRLEAHKK